MRRFTPDYSNKLVFDIVDGAECFSGLGDKLAAGAMLVRV